VRRAVIVASLLLAFTLPWEVRADHGIAATFTVDSTGDDPDSNLTDSLCKIASGSCTLRAAIEQSNADPARDLVVFSITGDGPHTIRPMAPLPIILGNVIIDGYSQPGALPDTNPVDFNNDANLKIELDGSLAGPLTNGLQVEGNEHDPYPFRRFVVQGLAINRFSGNGIVFADAGGQVDGNFIGVDISGTIGRGNGGSGIVHVRSGAVIRGNVISGNHAFGLYAEKIDDVPGGGNLIGTSASGTAAVGNRSGGAFFLRVGDFGFNGNLVSGNGGPGIQVVDSAEVYISRNLIGTQADGESPLGNEGSGLTIVDTAGGTIVGGSGSNTIAFNDGNGIELIGPRTIANLVGNSIHSNAGLGIDLGGDGITQNDHDDHDAGPNHFQNFADVTSVRSVGGVTTIRGSLRSEPPLSQYEAEHSLEFYSSPDCDASGYGEGQRFIGRAYRSVDQRGRARFEVTLPVAVAAGHYITMTADRWDRGTSEFSRCRIVH